MEVNHDIRATTFTAILLWVLLGGAGVLPNALAADEPSAHAPETIQNGNSSDHIIQSETPVQSEQPKDHSAHQQLLQQKNYTRKTQDYAVPQVTLSNQNGEKLFLPDLLEADEPVLLNFIYTTCVTICPVLTASFSEVQTALGPEAGNVKMVSISIDPEHDTPQILKNYGARYQAADGWQFLTGDLADIVLVLKSFDAYRRDKMNHIPLTFLRGAPNGTWTRLEGFPSVRELMEEFLAVNVHAAHQH